MDDEILGITTVYSITKRVGGPPMVLRMDLDLPGTDTAGVRVSLPRKHRPELRDVGRRGVILDPLLQLRNAAGTRLGADAERREGRVLLRDR